jgi:Zn-dependent protease
MASTRSGLRFSLAGFEVSVPLNTLLGVALIAWLWLPSFAGNSPARQWGSAIIFSVVLLASVLLHELAHAVAARRFGFPVLGITLWAFGGFTSYRPTRNTPGREAAIAVSGPFATMLLAIVAWFGWQQVPDPSAMPAEILAAVALANALVAVFNMLPGLPLDGGSVLSAGVWALTGSRITGQRVAAYAGMVLAALVVAAPLWLSWQGGGQADLGFLAVSILVAAFLFIGAKGALQNADTQAPLEGRTALDLASPAVVVPESATLAALDGFLAAADPAQGIVALVGNPATGLLGYVLPPASAAVPVGQRSTTTISMVTRSVPRWGWVAAASPAADAVEMLQHLQAPVVVVDAANAPIGVIIAGPPRP